MAKFKFEIRGKFEPRNIEKVKDAENLLYDYMSPFVTDDEDLNMGNLKIKVSKGVKK